MRAKSVLPVLSLLALVIVSSGCMGQGSDESQMEAQTLVEEGNVLNYSSESQDLSLVFFNETESSIMIGRSGGMVLDTRKLYKENWTTPEGQIDFVLFLSTLLSRAEEGKVDSLMEEGKSVSVNPSGVSSVNLSRSEMFEWEGFKAYNVTFEGENSGGVFTYHVREPYVLLSAGLEGENLVLSSVGTTDSPEDLIKESSSLVEETRGEVRDVSRAQTTELQLTPVYASGTGSGEDQIMVRVTNTGDRAVNASEFTMYYAPPNFPSPVSYSVLPEDWKVADGNNCLTGSQIIAQGDFMECETGVKFPEALETVEISVRADEFDYEQVVTCAVESSEARTC